MSERRSTAHPILVSTENGAITGCPAETECGLWGSGVLKASTQDKSSGRVALLAVGCDSCALTPAAEKHVGPIGILQHAELELPAEVIGDHSAAVDVMQKLASAMLGREVQSAAPTHLPDSL